MRHRWIGVLVANVDVIKNEDGHMAARFESDIQMVGVVCGDCRKCVGCGFGTECSKLQEECEHAIGL